MKICLHIRENWDKALGDTFTHSFCLAKRQRDCALFIHAVNRSYNRGHLAQENGEKTGFQCVSTTIKPLHKTTAILFNLMKE